MNSYPSRTDYDMAVQHFDKFVLVPPLKGGKPKQIIAKHNSRQLISYSGGYSIVYQIQHTNGVFALRCWTKNPGNFRDRYSKAKEYLMPRNLPYFVKFGYSERGILVGDVQYPISYMEWIEGRTLSQFLNENIQKPPLVREIARKFFIMVRHLHEHSISHGDLQDGNIMVCTGKNSIELKLVDYDSLYVPSLRDLSINDELPGVIHYQHPKRSKHSTEKSDYFSELVIYLSLLAYAEKPNLWKEDQEKQLLFSDSDFHPASHKNRDVFETLNRLPDPIPTLAFKLKEFCYEQDTSRLLPLEQIVPPDSKRESRHKPGTDKNSGTAAFNDFFGQPSISQTSSKPGSSSNLDKKPHSNEFNDYFKQTSKQQPTPKPKPTPSPSSRQDSGWGGAIVIIIIAAILIYFISKCF